nr:MAG TPA: hypothetical protein [Caudoviricetes sp.]
MPCISHILLIFINFYRKILYSVVFFYKNFILCFGLN